MKVRRQKKIIEIIENQNISTQEDLAEALLKAGFEATQATVSRDIKELGLIKIPGDNNTYRYSVPGEQGMTLNEDKLKRMFRELVVSVDYSDNIIVLRTYPGNAHGIASLIDGSKWAQVIGTVAGDDTILMVVKDSEKRKVSGEVLKLMQRIKALME